MTRFLTTSDVASALQVTPGTVCEWCRRGKIRALRFGRGWRVSVDDFETFIELTRNEQTEAKRLKQEELKAERDYHRGLLDEMTRMSRRQKA